MIFDKKKFEISIIGSGSQANKIFEICKKITKIKKIIRYHYKPKENFTNDFSKIFQLIFQGKLMKKQPIITDQKLL